MHNSVGRNLQERSADQEIEANTTRVLRVVVLLRNTTGIALLRGVAKMPGDAAEGRC